MPGFEPPTSRPDTSWLEGRQALGFAALLLGAFGLLFLVLTVAGLLGAARFQLADAGLAVVCLVGSWLILRFRRRTR